MSQRNSGYSRENDDLYETPEWVTRSLFPFTRRWGSIMEPAAGRGAMVKVLRPHYKVVYAVDTQPHPGIDHVGDFLQIKDYCPVDGIIGNPPYTYAEEFCAHALELMRERGGFVAMLLRTDFDHAKRRVHLFRDNPVFQRKVVLLRRIVWFTEADGRPKASPSFNHAWFIWDHLHVGPPQIAYATGDE